MSLKEEGWYTDPYARHEQRWMSDGQATKLVRDGSTTSYDPPPDEPPAHPPVPIDEAPGAGPSDLRRADDAERDGSA